MATYDNGSGLAYPLTKMNFLVTVDGVDGTAAFSEVSGVESSVDVIEFRQGNAHSLATVKIPGLVKHGNITLKFGYTLDSAFKNWILECVSDAEKLQLSLHDTALEEEYTACEDAGLKIMELTDRDKWIEAVKETSAAYAQENGELGQKIYSVIQDIQNK